MENILVSDSGKVKIIDFGFSIQCEKDAKLVLSCGTPAYMPPEIVLKKAYSGFSADIWSLGVILYILLTGKHPFKHKNEQELFNRIIVGEITPSTTISFDAMRLVTRMLS
jgi:serine/threonine protein kinase